MKFTLKILLLLVLIFLGVNWLSPLFTERNKAYMAHESYTHLNEEVSIAILGSSHAVNGIDPRILELETGAVTFNFADEGQKMVSTINVLEKVLKDQKPDLIILDVFYGSVALDYEKDERTKENQYNTLDYLPFTWSKLQTHKEVFGLSKSLDVFPLIRRHAAWPEVLSGKDFELNEAIDYSQGLFSNYRFLPKKWEESYNKRMEHLKNSATSEKNTDLTSKQKQQLQEIITACNEQEVPLLFVSCPFNLELHSQIIKEEQFKLIQYLKEEGQTVLDLSAEWGRTHLTKEQYSNFDHLNSTGALLTTKAISDYVTKNFQFSKMSDKSAHFGRNRYAVMRNPEQWAYFYKTFPEKSIEAQLGIRSLAVYQPYPERSELIIEIDSLEMTFPIRTTYYPEPEHGFMTKPTNSHKATNKFEFEGTSYLVVPINHPLEFFENLEIRKGGSGPTPVLLYQGEMSLESGNRGER